MPVKEKCLIIDGNNLLYSSYHVSLKLPWKMKKGTMFFFLRVIISILKKGNYQKLLVTFDGGGTNFRKTLFPEYKAQRVSMPDELWEQMEEIKSLLKKININYIQLINCEADDVIASFVSQMTKIYPHITFDILTRDKDLLQLLNENINILKYNNRKPIIYTYNHFLNEYNFSPQNFVDYLSLLGDNVDNILGVRGIGPVSTKNLINQFQTVENIYQEINSLPKNYKILLENKQNLVLDNKKLVSLEKDIPLPINIYQESDFNWEQWKDNKELRKFCLDNKFMSVIKLLN